MNRYIRKKDVIASKIDDEIIMVSIDSGHYFTLNSTGATIWNLLVEPKSIDEICLELKSEYEIDDSELTSFATDFINKLLKYKVIVSV